MFMLLNRTRKGEGEKDLERDIKSEGNGVCMYGNSICAIKSSIMCHNMWHIIVVFLMATYSLVIKFKFYSMHMS